MSSIASRKRATTPALETVEVSESVQFTTALKVDRAAKVIYGVKVCGFESVNGRTYTAKALSEATKEYEGVGVNLDHPNGPLTQPRSFEDRVGRLFNVRFVEGEGLFADLRINSAHPAAERIYTDAAEGTGFYGLSHNADLGGEYDKAGKFVIQKILKVRHVDIVADPATTTSLSESREHAMTVAEQQAAEAAELKKKKAKEEEDEEEMKKKKAKEEADEKDKETSAEKCMKEQADAITALKADLAKRDRRDAVVTACESAGYKPDADTMTILIGLETAQRDTLVKKLAAADKAGTPRAGVFGTGTVESVVESSGGQKLSDLKGESLAAFLLN